MTDTPHKVIPHDDGAKARHMREAAQQVDIFYRNQKLFEADRLVLAEVADMASYSLARLWDQVIGSSGYKEVVTDYAVLTLDQQTTLAQVNAYSAELALVLEEILKDQVARPPKERNAYIISMIGRVIKR